MTDIVSDALHRLWMIGAGNNVSIQIRAAPTITPAQWRNISIKIKKSHVVETFRTRFVYPMNFTDCEWLFLLAQQETIYQFNTNQNWDGAACCQRGESSWLLHHFRDFGMLEIGSSQHGKFVGEIQKQVQNFRNGLGLRQEICPQDTKGCFIAYLLVSYQQWPSLMQAWK